MLQACVRAELHPLQSPEDQILPLSRSARVWFYEFTPTSVGTAGHVTVEVAAESVEHTEANMAAQSL